MKNLEVPKIVVKHLSGYFKSIRVLFVYFRKLKYPKWHLSGYFKSIRVLFGYFRKLKYTKMRFQASIRVLQSIRVLISNSLKYTFCLSGYFKVIRVLCVLQKCTSEVYFKSVLQNLSGFFSDLSGYFRNFWCTSGIYPGSRVNFGTSDML